MIEKAIIDRIDFSKSEQYTLSIRLSTDGFSFSIFDPILGQLHYISYKINPELPMSINIRDMIRETEIMRLNYKTVNILYNSKRFTLIPADLFNEKESESFFYYNFKKQANEQLLFNPLQRADAIIAFGMDKNSHQQLSSYYPNAKFLSQITLLAEYFASKSRLGNCKKMYIHNQNNNLTIYCFDRGKLLLINLFETKYPEDKTYYILNIWKQLSYDQERDELHILSDSNKIFADQIKHYIKKVFIINTQLSLNSIEQINPENSHLDLQLLSTNELGL